MTHRLATNYAKKVIVENVVTCFLGTRCSDYTVTILMLIWSQTVTLLLIVCVGWHGIQYIDMTVLIC